MASIGEGWADGAWVYGSWANNAWFGAGALLKTRAFEARVVLSSAEPGSRRLIASDLPFEGRVRIGGPIVQVVKIGK